MLESNLSCEAYRRLEHNNPAHQEFVVINWCLGNTCNYACSYCPAGLHDGSIPFPEKSVVLGFIEKTIEHYAGRKLYFEFTGGEVTLWKDLLPVADYLHERGCKIGIISNGSRGLDFFAKLIEKIDHICLSFHPESAKEEHFLSVVKFCSEKVRTHVNLMMSPELFNKSLALSLKVKDIPNISIALQPLVENLSGPTLIYNDIQSKAMNRQHELLVKHIKYTKSYEYYRGAMAMVTESGERRTIAPQRFISSATNNWEGWDCYAGIEQIVIDLDRKIYRGWCKAGGDIGSIDQENLSLPKEPISCPKNNCHCNLDIMTTKVKAK